MDITSFSLYGLVPILEAMGGYFISLKFLHAIKPNCKKEKDYDKIVLHLEKFYSYIKIRDNIKTIYVDNLAHCSYGPARIYKGEVFFGGGIPTIYILEEWYQSGQLYRTDGGPSLIGYDENGNKIFEEWYISGIKRKNIYIEYDRKIEKTYNIFGWLEKEIITKGNTVDEYYKGEIKRYVDGTLAYDGEVEREKRWREHRLNDLLYRVEKSWYKKIIDFFSLR